MKTPLIFYCFLIIIGMLMHPGYSQNISVKITGLESSEGVIQLAVFTSQKNFDNEIAVIQKAFPKTGMKGGEVQVTLKLKPGTYGIAAFDDKNSDKELNTNFFGIPTEGFGFSNCESFWIGSPDFSEFSFYAGSVTTLVTVKMRYIF